MPKYAGVEPHALGRNAPLNGCLIHRCKLRIASGSPRPREIFSLLFSIIYGAKRTGFQKWCGKHATILNVARGWNRDVVWRPPFAQELTGSQSFLSGRRRVRTWYGVILFFYAAASVRKGKE